MKYIPAEKLIAEMERLEALYDEALKNPAFASYESGLIAKGKHRQREDLLSLITSLQQEQPEVDLEKEAKDCWDYVFALGWDDNSFMTMNYKEFLAFASHFYELGLNARKEE